jgi:hypothetical protein
MGSALRWYRRLKIVSDRTKEATHFMLDLLFLAAGIVFFIACWYLTKACERL